MQASPLNVTLAAHCLDRLKAARCGMCCNCLDRELVSFNSPVLASLSIQGLRCAAQ